MGNDHNANSNSNDDGNPTDFISKLRHRFSDSSNRNHISNTSQQRNNSKHNGKVNTMDITKPKLPTCPICFMEVEDYINLKNCNHLICKECLNGYISTDLKNIIKYPLKCFQQNCDELLDFVDVQYALNFNKDSLFIFNKFSILCAISPKEREQCPKCEMVFFYQSKWQRDKVKPFKWIDDNERDKCHNPVCNKTFIGFIVRRHHCRICGEIFCNQCSSNLLPLSAASNSMLKQWIKTNTDQSQNYENNKSHNSNNKQVENAKKWFNNTIAASTSQDLWSDSDDDDEDDIKLDENGNFIQESRKKRKKEDKEEEKKEEEKKEEKEFALSPSEQELIEDERVRCCYPCWLDYYRGICAECDYQYCIQCRQEWHDNYDCEEIKKEKKAIYLRKKLNDAQTEELMLREGWRRCAGCKVWVAKSEGCNHMLSVYYIIYFT